MYTTRRGGFDREDARLHYQQLQRDNASWQTQARGTNDNEYQIYLSCANDGKGGDITRGGAHPSDIEDGSIQFASDHLIPEPETETGEDLAQFYGPSAR